MVESYPEIIKVRLNKDDVNIENSIETHLKKAVKAIDLEKKCRNKKIGITVGSRGISKIKEIIFMLAETVTEFGGKPYLIPCMGTQGGESASGQIDILKEIGITESPLYSIVKSIDTVKIGYSPKGIPVYVNNVTNNLDGILVVNRVKSHTDFSGDVESGLCKMLVVGLGGPEGAKTFHHYGLNIGHSNCLKDMVGIILKNVNIIGGISIVENVYSRLLSINGVLPIDFVSSDVNLLIKAKQNCSKLPFDEIDVLVVEKIGKNFSGSGMDAKVVGRFYGSHGLILGTPKVKRVVALDLSKESEGNATGVGLADFITRKLYNKINFKATWLNSAGSVPEQGKIPITFNSEKEAFDYAITTSGVLIPSKLKYVQIANTSSLNEIIISKALLKEAFDKNYINCNTLDEVLSFDKRGCFTYRLS